MTIDKFFLDSGAFSADKQGKPIILQDYIDFIKEHEEHLTAYAVLDVIGDYEKSWENQDIMEDQGLKPLPVFHMEDPEFCLDWCLEYDYFCLGGMAGNPSRNRRIDFLDSCWDRITDSKGFPKCKVHGFGMASSELIARYPWYSVDSSSPVSYSTNGYVIMPNMSAGTFNYEKPPYVFFVSARPSKADKGTIHLQYYSENEKKVFQDYIEKDLGIPFGKSEIFEVSEEYECKENEKKFGKKKDLVERIEEEGIINSDFYRNVANYKFYAEMCSRQPKFPNNRWKFKKIKLF